MQQQQCIEMVCSVVWVKVDGGQKLENDSMVLLTGCWGETGDSGGEFSIWQSIELVSIHMEREPCLLATLHFTKMATTWGISHSLFQGKVSQTQVRISQTDAIFCVHIEYDSLPFLFEAGWSISHSTTSLMIGVKLGLAVIDPCADRILIMFRKEIIYSSTTSDNVKR